MDVNRRIIAPLFLVVSLAAAGCGGSTSSSPATANPSPTATATATATPTVAPTASTTPGSGPTYTLGGSSTQMTLTAGQTPAQASLSAYQNISLTAQFAAVVSGSGTITLSDATGSGDITPTTLPPDNASTATPMLYVSFYNPGSTDINFGTNFPTVKMTDSSGFGTKTTCEFDVYSKNNSNVLAWNSILSGPISGTSVTIGPSTLPAGNTIDFQPNTQQMVAIACK